MKPESKSLLFHKKNGSSCNDSAYDILDNDKVYSLLI
jgi:hypothetical protein